MPKIEALPWTVYVDFLIWDRLQRLALRIDCRVEGIGVDPKDPPLVWEVWCGDVKNWARADVERDETGGLNQEGTVVLHQLVTSDVTKAIGFYQRNPIGTPVFVVR